MFLPGYAEPILAMAGAGCLLGLYGLWMIHQRRRERAALDVEK